jgi:hypothetical protein
MNASAPSRKPVPRTRKNILQRAVGWLAAHAPYLKCHTPDVKYGLAESCAEDDPADCPRWPLARTRSPGSPTPPANCATSPKTNAELTYRNRQHRNRQHRNRLTAGFAVHWLA